MNLHCLFGIMLMDGITNIMKKKTLLDWDNGKLHIDLNQRTTQW